MTGEQAVWCAAACLVTGAAVEAWRPSAARLLATRWGRVPRGRSTPRPRPIWAVVPVGVVLVAWVSGPALVFGLAVAGVGGVFVELARRGRRRGAETRLRREVVDALSFLVSELRAGAVPAQALAAMTREVDTLPAIEHATALQGAAQRPGCEALADLAAAWEVAERCGAPMADVVARLVERVRDDLDLDREVDAELAPARATARIMALLPLAALGLGSSMGGDPVHVVTGTWPGAIAAALGLALAGCGLVWVERVAGSVAR